jgi:hypothetical protein
MNGKNPAKKPSAKFILVWSLRPPLEPSGNGGARPRSCSGVDRRQCVRPPAPRRVSLRRGARRVPPDLERCREIARTMANRIRMIKPIESKPTRKYFVRALQEIVADSFLFFRKRGKVLGHLSDTKLVLSPELLTSYSHTHE